MIQGILRTGAGLFLLLGLVSCASISVEDGTERLTQKMPETIYVLDFSTAHGDFRADRTGQEFVDFKKNLQLMLKTAIAADLTDKLMFSAPGTKADWAQHKNAWLVTGEFTTVKQGSRFLRSAVGFGAGGTKVETRVQVYSLLQDSAKPFLTFSTTGGSGAEPGAIAGLTDDPLQLAIGAVSGAAHGVSEDTARTAREITAELSNYMYDRGWISEDKWIKPKRERATDTW
jgi:Domain of unknown function (DUF4410)